MDTKDIVDIYQLEAFCHHAVDHEDQSLLPLVFTPDARFDSSGAGGNAPVCDGLDAICAYFALGKPPHPAAHHMTNCWVYEKDGKVRVRMKWMIANPANGQMVGGTNDDWVVQTPDGWRIKERIARLKYPAHGFAAG